MHPNRLLALVLLAAVSANAAAEEFRIGVFELADGSRLEVISSQAYKVEGEEGFYVVTSHGERRNIKKDAVKSFTTRMKDLKDLPQYTQQSYAKWKEDQAKQQEQGEAFREAAAQKVATEKAEAPMRAQAEKAMQAAQREAFAARARADQIPARIGVLERGIHTSGIEQARAVAQYDAAKLELNALLARPPKEQDANFKKIVSLRQQMQGFLALATHYQGLVEAAKRDIARLEAERPAAVAAALAAEANYKEHAAYVANKGWRQVTAQANAEPEQEPVAPPPPVQQPVAQQPPAQQPKVEPEIKLESILDGYLVVDGTYLGKISRDKYDTKSILNDYGKHGSTYERECIFNTLGDYGGTIGRHSPFNTTTFDPPKIYTKDGAFVGYLSKNTTLTPRLDPDVLIGWLKNE